MRSLRPSAGWTKYLFPDSGTVGSASRVSQGVLRTRALLSWRYYCWVFNADYAISSTLYEPITNAAHPWQVPAAQDQQGGKTEEDQETPCKGMSSTDQTAAQDRQDGGGPGGPPSPRTRAAPTCSQDRQYEAGPGHPPKGMSG
eukprot:TRINITY_DN10134_c0_g2_i2.p2 TRINITY_DN10134_c0_g2~~TRINITY_DN10134_c0_g2_i2.p2  ORF type:complete len:143 (+),score=6.58 TRINITY_DN10134_c0_g2_i2:84-512(+)